MNARGINKTAFAAAIGVSYINVSDWQSGRSSPSVEKLERIADYFGVSFDYLVGRDYRTVVLGAAYQEKFKCSNDVSGRE